MSDAARPRALVSLLDGIIDYAGLFPPAGLAMGDAVARFARHRSSPDAWALGRFVVPAARLDEFDREMDRLSAGRVESGSGRAWPLTALASLPLDADLARIAAFNDAHTAAGARPARIDSVEVKAASANEITQASQCAPRDLEIFFEVPAHGGMDDLSHAAAAARRGLKLRTGGTSIDAFPPSAVVARFLCACAATRVPFKATAGLHHPIRSSHPVTYEAGAPSATMHGFLNLFVAAALLLAGRADVATATRVLEDELPASFSFDEAGLGWRELRLDVDEVLRGRATARSFGSCSFDEPLSELNVIGRHFPIGPPGMTNL